MTKTPLTDTLERTRGVDYIQAYTDALKLCYKLERKLNKLKRKQQDTQDYYDGLEVR